MKGDLKMYSAPGFANAGFPGLPEANIMRQPPNIPSNESTLWVGNLNPRMHEQRFYELFAGCQVENCRIMRDTYSAESRRFGFVSFSSPAEAEKAKNTYNYTIFDGYEIRMCFKRNPSDFKAAANIFIKNLSPETSARELEAQCSKFGKVLSCVIRTDDNGKSLGYGYVQFEEEAAAVAAVEKLNDAEIHRQKISVQKFVPQKNRPASKRNIYLKNFPKGWTKEKVTEELTKYLGKFGKTDSIGIYEHADPITHTPGFYAFASFETEAAAEKAINESNGRDFEKLVKGEPTEPSTEPTAFYVGQAMSKRARKAMFKKQNSTQRAATNVFIKSLNLTTTEEMLRAAFEKYGKITSICLKESLIVPGTSFPQLKYGFINFSTGSEAETAIYQGKKDADILALVSLPPKNKEFLFFHQPKQVRDAYIRMKQKMTTDFRQSRMMSGIPMQYAQMNIPIGMGMGIGMGQMNMNFPVNVPAPQQTFTPGTVSRHSEKETSYTVDWLKKNKKEFSDLSKEKQKSILGNLMYNRVNDSKMASRNQVPKVTGMLIDLEILEYEEIIDILENDEALKSRITEALEIIEEPGP